MGKKAAKTKTIIPKWKAVEIKGSIIADGEDFDGFGGLEVLENYDSSFLLGSKKQNVRFP